MTVSKVLNDRGDEFGIAKDTQERIWEIATRLNYQRTERATSAWARVQSILFYPCTRDGQKERRGFFSPFFGIVLTDQEAVTRSGFYLSYVAVDEESMETVKPSFRIALAVLQQGTMPLISPSCLSAVACLW